MRIGILTFHRSVNNGALIQCYALSKRLQKDFPYDTVEVIDYHMPKVDAAYSTSFRHYFKGGSLRDKLAKCYHFIRNPKMFSQIEKKNAVFREALLALPLSPETLFDNSDTSFVKYVNEHYDVLIVGSDAVWNYVMRGFPNAYFPDDRVNCYKLSYAASCNGMEFLDLPEHERKQIGHIFCHFTFLGVRDAVTEDFVKWSGCGKPAIHTCDPTVFLNVNDLPVNVDALNQKLIRKGLNPDRPTIGVMGNEKMLKMVRHFYGNSYQIAALYHYIPGADVQLYDLTPYEWAYVFRYFKLTFTTYFHGTMLSLKNGVPVICIALPTNFYKRHTPKTKDLLTRLGCEDCYFTTDYVSENLDAIKVKADELLRQQDAEEIMKKIEKEAKSYDDFRIVLEEIAK